jgi:broad specificity phosphatase PhoE
MGVSTVTDTLPVTLLLIRHGRTAWNAERRVLGRTDIELDDVGRSQAAGLSARLGPVDAVWSSPLTRARQTAEALGHPVREDPGLIEMDQGHMEGLDAAALMETYGETVLRWRANPAGIRLPGGEVMEEVQERALAALRRIADAHPPGHRVAVVTHQLVLASLCVHLSGASLAEWTRYTHDNCCWSLVEVGGALRLTAIKQSGASR